jgi:hypothetical protein
MLAAGESLPVCKIQRSLENPPASLLLRHDFYHLKRLGLIGSKGYGQYWCDHSCNRERHQLMKLPNKVWMG